MIDALSFDDCCTAYRVLRQNLRVDLGFDREKVTGLIRAHGELLRSTAGRDEHVAVLDLVTHLIPACAGLAMLGGDLDARLGLAVVDVWLSRNGYVLLPSPADRVAILEVLGHVPDLPLLPAAEHLDAVRSWAGRTVAEAATGTTLAEHAGTADVPQPLRCFVASPLTSVPAEEAGPIDVLCDATASVLSEFGVLVLQPRIYTSPRLTPVDVNDPVYRSIDERLIAESDLVVVIATRTSLGLGAVAYTAHRYHKHLIVGTASGTVTPMITGLDPAPAIIDLDRLENGLRRHLCAVLPLVEENSRRSRVELSRIGAELARLRSRIDDGPAGGCGPPGHLVLNRERLRELIESPELFAGATFREVRELYELAGE